MQEHGLFVVNISQDKEANKQKIMALIERKKDEALAGKPLDELQALLSTM